MNSFANEDHGSNHTPMMQQFFSIKAKYPNSMVFFRLGDFYELFYDDAREAAEILDITLTSRGKSGGDPIPMCGVPFHSADSYLAKLIKMDFLLPFASKLETQIRQKDRLKDKL